MRTSPLVTGFSTALALAGLLTACGKLPTGPSKPLVPGTVAISPTTGIVGTTVTFTSQGASDRDGDALSYNWDFGDGGTATGASATHVYATAQTFTVTVMVSDGKQSVSATGSIGVKSLTGQWRGSLQACCLHGDDYVLDTVLNLTQSGTSLSGSYSDQFDSGSIRAGSFSSVNASTRRVDLAIDLPRPELFRSFNGGTPNTDVTVLTGTAAGPLFVLVPWNLTRQ